MATKSQSLITAKINGADTGVWDTRAGGDTTASPSQYRPGGGGVVVDAARATTGDVTITRRYDLDRDHDKAAEWRPLVGVAGITITEQPLGTDGLPWGKPTTWTGRLTGVNTDDTDSNSDDPRTITVTMMVTSVTN